MASVTSATTEAEIIALYLDNCGYEEDGDAAMARRLVTAISAMRMRGMRRIETDGQIIELDPADLRDQMMTARRFASANTRRTHKQYITKGLRLH